MLDLDRVWERFVSAHLNDRDAPNEIHASDLAACRYAVWQRLNGIPQLPATLMDLENFTRGLAYEGLLHDYLVAEALAQGHALTHGERVEHLGVIGNLDWVEYHGDFPLATYDLSVPRTVEPRWKGGHALKSAFYALAKGVSTFVEVVISMPSNFPNAKEPKLPRFAAHRFDVDEVFDGMTWRERVETAAAEVTALPGAIAPPQDPPIDILDGKPQDWLCKSYCRARCSKNARYDSAEDEMEIPT